MIIQDAKFTGSYTRVQDTPTDQPAFAFIGRSNVGKSSLINTLTNRKKLAKTSVTPGKTQLLNYFFINDSWYLVDLPGYGYAKVSKTARRSWEKMIRDFMIKSPNLVNVFVLVDVRLEPQQIDIDFINWLGEMQVPFSIIFTKSDKNSGPKNDQKVALFKKTMKAKWAELPPIFVSSSVNKEGKDKILEYIAQVLENTGNGKG